MDRSSFVGGLATGLAGGVAALIASRACTGPTEEYPAKPSESAPEHTPEQPKPSHPNTEVQDDVAEALEEMKQAQGVRILSLERELETKTAAHLGELLLLENRISTLEQALREARQPTRDPVESGAVHESEGDEAADFLVVQCFGDCLFSGRLGETRVGDLPYDRVVGSVSHDALMTDALQILTTQSASCLRVLGPHQKFLGVLNITDVAVFLLQAEFAVVSRPVGDVLRTCGSVSQSATLRQVVRYFQRGYDYITVRGSDDRLMSQASVLRFINQHLVEGKGSDGSNEASLGTLQAAECTSTLPRVDLMRPTTEPIRATVGHMVASGIRSVSLVDTEERVTAVLSLSDVKRMAGIDASNDDLMAMDAITFLQRSRQDSRPVDHVVGCLPTTPATAVLSMMVEEGVHAVVVWDKDGRFRGTVTTGSLLSAITR